MLCSVWEHILTGLANIIVRISMWIFGGLAPNGNRQTFCRSRHDFVVWLLSVRPSWPVYRNCVCSRDFQFPNHNDGFLNNARVYSPSGVEDKQCPVIIYIHGGGWTIHSHRLFFYDWHVRKLCKELRVHIVSIDYRLAPEHPYPTPVEDCYSALLWVASSKEMLPFMDPQRLIVMGDSADANLAAAVSMLYRDRQPSGFHIQQQVLLQPCMAKK